MKVDNYHINPVITAQFEPGFVRIVCGKKPVSVLWGKMISIKPQWNQWRITIDTGINPYVRAVPSGPIVHNYISIWVDKVENRMGKCYII